jgi:SNF2 domain-containing protein
MTDQVTQARLRVADDVLLIEGVESTRPVRLFLEGVLGASPFDGGWRAEPKSRTLEELCIVVNRWFNKRGLSPELVGVVDVSVERDLERQRSFVRARDAGTQFRAGTPALAPDTFRRLLNEAGWAHEDRQLREHQTSAALHALTAANAANFSVPGAGKTATTLAVAAAQRAAGNIDLVLVVGPLASFQPWESETSICLPTWPTLRLTGSAAERRKRIRSLLSSSLDPTVVLTSYAGAVNDVAALKELCRNLRVMLVADESHRIKRFRGGQWAPAVVDIAKLAVIRMVLSGTPMPQSGLDLYSQLNVMWPGRELTGSRERFKPRVERQFGQVIDSVLPFVSRTSKADLGLRPYTVEVHDVELNPAEADVYDLLQNHLRRAVQSANPNEADRLAALRRGRPIRLLQAATNPAILQDSGYGRVSEGATPTLLRRLGELDTKAAPPAKYRFAGEILAQLGSDEKCVVWSNFIRNLDHFAEYVRQNLGIAVYQVDGRIAARQDVSSSDPERDVSDSDEGSREAVIANFLHHRGKAILVTNPASCSESISLHRSCRNAIYLDRTYDCAQWLQSIDRIHRLGLPPDAEVRVHVLRALAGGQPTADQLVQTSLAGKESRMLMLLEGAALAPLEENSDARREISLVCLHGTVRGATRRGNNDHSESRGGRALDPVCVSAAASSCPRWLPCRASCARMPRGARAGGNGRRCACSYP